MDKYSLIPSQLLHQGIVREDQFFSPALAAVQTLLLTHGEEYVHAVLSLQLEPRAMRKIGFPLSQQLADRERIITQGTIECALAALKEGAAMNVAGGTHHAYKNSGEGFCLFNDFAVSANYLFHHEKIKKIAVIDLDVHQGNGTAAIFQNDPRVYTFSIHGKDNYPHHKEQSDWDIPLRTGTQGEEYLQRLKEALPKIYALAQPELVFFVSGVDVLAGDKLGKLSLTKAECRERDRLVARFFAERNIPLVAAMGGGYAPQIADIVDAHCATFEEIQSAYFV